MKFFSNLLFFSFFLIPTLVLAEPIGASPESGIDPCPVCQCETTTTTLLGSTSSTTTTTSAPAVCQLYALNFSHANGPSSKQTEVRISSVKGDASGAGCFANIVNTAFGSNVYSGNSNFSQTSHKLGATITDKIWEALLANSGRDRSTYAANKSYIKCTGKYDNVSLHNSVNQIGGGAGNSKDNSQPGCTAGTLYFDNECKLKTVASVGSASNACGSLNYYSEMHTPISLVWSDSYRDIPSTVVSFKLNPYSNNDHWLWRGSQSLPLLVYDPEHRGEITSASQLLGNWSFHLAKTASLNERIEIESPWSNGYQALASLDTNNDAKVSGEELRDLALWFDTNQDGISQEGEVRSLAEENVISLSYKVDSTEDGGLVVSSGYERIVDGKTVVGKSIDWVEKSYKNTVVGILDSLYGKSLDNAPIKSIKEEVVVESPEAARESLLAKKLAGLWAFEIERPLEGAGYLAFDLTSDSLTGTTMSEVGVKGVSGLGSQLVFSSFEVQTNLTGDGMAGIIFYVDGQNGSKLKNTAKLSADGSELIGETVVTDSKVSATGKYEYKWRAKKIR